MSEKRHFSIEEVRAEAERARYLNQFRETLLSTIYGLLIVIAVALLIATLLFPILQVYSSAMAPTMKERCIVLVAKTSQPKKGDVTAFWYNNKILIRRVIATSEDTVIISENGAVSVNDRYLSEPYVMEPSGENCDIEFPYEVPPGTFFMLGDNRKTAIDSRATVVGCISEEDIIGTVKLVVWPFSEFGPVR